MDSPLSSILIIGSGVFGLSTAHALSQRPSFSSTTITVLDRSPFPSPDGSSIDTSRIIRADYSDPAYASLAAAAQEEWRKQGPNDLGGEGRYTESGLVLVADRGAPGEHYVRESQANVCSLMATAGDRDAVCELPTRASIEEALGTGGGSGDWGYINRRSGWADAEGGMVWLRRKVELSGRVGFRHVEVETLIKEGKKVVGVKLADGEKVRADLVILATGAWTGKLVDLRGRAQATGQVLAYLPITEEEQERFRDMPVLLNMSTGLFIIPPRNRILKVARHAYGYANPVSIQNPDDGEEMVEVSLPRTSWEVKDQWIPREGEEACRQALREMIPSLADRKFTQARICWYTDTPHGDFLITYHPALEGLFVATGGSGHGYKFLPVIGERIVDAVEGRCPVEFEGKWAWPRERVESVVTEDGSRGGVPGMELMDEFGRLRGDECVVQIERYY
ncbi:L-pipecolate oxidase [Hyphodiscus hymeniophilus]|uniref:L-pipecolate oxidase n=1 Tax=Hyphodiscus hymeniophilus TaxID=353542 RepID=A0A9P7AYB2_9HELO|nr:L-pipecolate oxidase [Hyphodiscus hymeniophilus]